MRPQRSRRPSDRAFAEHHRGVYAAAFRILGDAAQAQDVVQDVFLRALAPPARVRRRPRRARRLPAPDGAARARSTCGARARCAAAPRPAQARGRRRRAAASTTSPPRAVERDADARGRARGARQLPEPQREALVLAYWGGLTADQIAAARARPARHRQEPHPARARAAARRIRRRVSLAHEAAPEAACAANLEQLVRSRRAARARSARGWGIPCSAKRLGVAARRSPHRPCRQTLTDEPYRRTSMLAIHTRSPCRCERRRAVPQRCLRGGRPAARPLMTQGTPIATVSKVDVSSAS